MTPTIKLLAKCTLYVLLGFLGLVFAAVSIDLAAHLLIFHFAGMICANSNTLSNQMKR